MTVILIETKAVPKGGRWDVTINSDINFHEISEWVRDNLSGTVYWRRTLFSDPKTRSRHTWDTRQVHFTEGYWVYTFWFTRKVDAALFRLSWY